VTTLDAAYKYMIADDSYKNVLVIGCYAMSKYIDWKDKKTSTLFADVRVRSCCNRRRRETFLASKLVLTEIS
jgi:3-oxoacyl-[acyl-carrier-protein] synthase-3